MRRADDIDPDVKESDRSPRSSRPAGRPTDAGAAAGVPRSTPML